MQDSQREPEYSPRFPEHDRKVVQVVQVGFYTIALFWLVLGAFTWFRMSGSLGAGIMLGLMWGNAVLQGWAGWGLGTCRRFYYWLGLVVLATNIILTITDEFGIYDLLTLVFDVGLFIILYPTRALFLISPPENSQSGGSHGSRT